MIYYTSDQHFWHTNIIKYQNRPFANAEEMNSHMIYQWNKKVKANDDIFILGDLAFCNGEQANELVKKLNGRKYLIKGNHDSFLRDSKFDPKAFQWIKDYAKIDDGGQKVVLFHYPIAVWDTQHHGALHVYGHVHDNVSTSHPLLFQIENAFNAGVDVHDYEPKTLKELMA